MKSPHSQRKTRAGKPRKLKRKRIEASMYANGFIQITRTHIATGTYLSAISLDGEEDVHALAKWLNKASAFLKARKR